MGISDSFMRYTCLDCGRISNDERDFICCPCCLGDFCVGCSTGIVLVKPDYLTNPDYGDQKVQYMTTHLEEIYGGYLDDIHRKEYDQNGIIRYPMSLEHAQGIEQDFVEAIPEDDLPAYISVLWAYVDSQGIYNKRMQNLIK